MKEGERLSGETSSVPSVLLLGQTAVSSLVNYLYVSVLGDDDDDDDEDCGRGTSTRISSASEEAKHSSYRVPLSTLTPIYEESAVELSTYSGYSGTAMNSGSRGQQGCMDDDSEENNAMNSSTPDRTDYYEEQEGSVSMGNVDIDDDLEFVTQGTPMSHGMVGASAPASAHGNGNGNPGARESALRGNGSFSNHSSRTRVVENLSSQGPGYSNVQDISCSNGEFLDLSEFMDPLQASLNDISPDFLEKIGNPTIEEDTPAAAAIRANAEVRVGRVSKAARSVNAQAIRKVVKKATLRGNFGSVRGKPPRVPPPQHAPDSSMFIWDEESDDDEDWKSCRSVSFSHDNTSLDYLGASSGRSQRSRSAPNVNQAFSANQNKMMSSPSHDGHSQAKIPSHAQAQHLQVSFADDVQVIKPQSMPSKQLMKPPSSRQTVPSREHSTSPIRSMDTYSSKNMQSERGELTEVIPGTIEAGDKVLGHVDPHDILKLKRKKKKNKKERKSYVKGKVIDGQHEKYTISIAVMLGVRTSIANLNAQIHTNARKRILLPGDFHATEKYEFSPKGSSKTPPHQLNHTFKFKDYAPVVFAYLRRLFGVNEYDFLLSVCGNANFIEFISNAKSGQFFFYSNDGKYMIKTMTNTESRFLRRILPSYFRHCTSNPNTLLTKFLGMYRVKLYHLRRNVKFVIMNSVYCTEKYLHGFYDLKGSVTGRDARPEEDVKKDNDLRRQLPDGALALAPEKREKVRKQVVSDCSFLRSAGVMDYSMLVGIHFIPVHHSNRSMNKGKPVSKRKLIAEKDPYCVGNESFRRNGGRAPRDGLDSLGAPASAYDDILDEDDGSYIEGCDRRPSGSPVSGSSTTNVEGERRKLQTIERIYWPFHKLYDLHGHRIGSPRKCFNCGSTECGCQADSGSENVTNLGPYFKGGLPKFVTPLSDRKDRGFLMDTEGMDFPQKFKGPRGEFLYEGKIFYMGIIDILQEFNQRKRVEASYRAFNGERHDASCVPPDEYARRFVHFFDQYTRRDYEHPNNAKGKAIARPTR